MRARSGEPSLRYASHGATSLGITRCQARCDTAKPQVGVDYRGQNRVEFVQNEKYSTKSGDFLRFLLYLCHVINPEPLGFAASRVEELFVAQVLIKKVKLKCCGIWVLMWWFNIMR